MATRALTVVSNRAPARRSRPMAKRRVHHKAKFTIPAALLLGAVPAGLNLYRGARDGGLTQFTRAGAAMIGYDTNAGRYVGWSLASTSGAFPLLLGFGLHMAASKFGVNRMLARARVPIIRI